MTPTGPAGEGTRAPQLSLGTVTKLPSICWDLSLVVPQPGELHEVSWSTLPSHGVQDPSTRIHPAALGREVDLTPEAPSSPPAPIPSQSFLHPWHLTSLYSAFFTVPSFRQGIIISCNNFLKGLLARFFFFPPSSNYILKQERSFQNTDLAQSILCLKLLYVPLIPQEPDTEDHP